MRLRLNSVIRCFLCAGVITAFVIGSGSRAHASDYGGYRPHYQGNGIDTRGGRGGSVCRVTSLSDTAWPAVAGTLRHCVENTQGPRFVIFEISGTINLAQGPLYVRNPYVTIAGQTAPSPGIVIRGQALIIDTHDVVVQHVRVRVGNVAGDPHAIWIRDDATRVVIDHVSASWSIWTALGFYAQNPGHPVGQVTVIDSIISEALGCSGVNSAVPCDPNSNKGWTNSRGIRLGDSWGHAQPKVTLLRNITAQINDRFPETSGGTETVFVNNLAYNPSQTPLSAMFYQDYANQGPILVRRARERPHSWTDHPGIQRVCCIGVSRRG